MRCTLQLSAVLFFTGDFTALHVVTGHLTALQLITVTSSALLALATPSYLYCPLLEMVQNVSLKTTKHKDNMLNCSHRCCIT